LIPAENVNGLSLQTEAGRYAGCSEAATSASTFRSLVQHLPGEGRIALGLLAGINCLLGPESKFVHNLAMGDPVCPLLRLGGIEVEALALRSARAP
jgi:hypothetical protein